MKKIIKIMLSLIILLLVYGIAFGCLKPKTAYASYYDIGDEYVRTGKEKEDYDNLTSKYKKETAKYEKLETKLAAYNEKHKFDSLGKAKVESWKNGCEIAKSSIDTLYSIYKDASDGGDFATIACINNVVSTISTIASCCGPYGQIVSACLNLAQGVSKMIIGGKEPTDAMTQMEDRLNQQFAEVKEELTLIEEELESLSDDINESTDKIIEELGNKIDQTVSYEHLREFKNRGTGNFSYTEYSNYLFGTDEEGYCNLLKQVQNTNCSSETIKRYYDLVYQNLKENTDIFYDSYLLPDDNKTIIRDYYEVMLSDTNTEDGDAEFETIKFAYGLYQAALNADQQILSCNFYQYTSIYTDWLNENINNEDFSFNDFDKDSLDLYYDYGTGKISLHEMNLLSDKISERENELVNQLSKDIAYILSLGESYIVSDNELYEVDKNCDSFGMISEGQTIYLNQLPEILFETFTDFSRESFTYKYSDSKAINEFFCQNGYFEIIKNGYNFTSTLYYLDEPLEETKITFTTIDIDNLTDFSGGDGSEYSPYLISNANQFKLISEDLSKNYRLISDIDFSAANLMDMFGNSNKKFTGSLDGNGHSIKNLTINGDDYAGLFAINSGEITNLSLKNVTIKADLKEALKSNSIFYAGIIAGLNEGKITNCRLEDCILDFDLDNTTTNRCITICAGGICGENDCLVSCCLIDAKIDVTSSHKFGGDATTSNKHSSYVGGICGVNNNMILNTIVKSESSINSKLTSKLSPSDTVNPYVSSYSGILIGTNNAKIQNIYCEENAKSKAEGIIEHYESQAPKGWKYRKQSSENVKVGDKSDDEFSQEVTYTMTELESKLVELGNFNFEFSYSYNQGKDVSYKVTEKKFHTDGLNIYYNNEKVESYSILMSYGFNPYNEDFVDKSQSVTLLISATLKNGSIVYGVIQNIPVVIQANSLSYSIENYDETIKIGDEFTLIGATLVKKDSFDNVEKNNINYDNIDRFSFETVDSYSVGNKQVIVIYEGLEIELLVDVTCDHSIDAETIEIELNDELVTVITENTYINSSKFEYLADESTEPTCSYYGKHIYLCQDCGEKIVVYLPKTGEHNLVEIKVEDASCENNGYILYGCCDCSYEHEIDGQVVIDYRYTEIEEIIKSGHNYQNDCDGMHKCSICGNTEYHQYSVSESTIFDEETQNDKLVYSYKCSLCGFEDTKYDDNYIKNGNTPLVIVTDAYALNAGDTVKVYINLQNNPGVTGAVFSIRFSKYLTLVDIEEGSKGFVFEGSVSDKVVRTNNESEEGNNVLGTYSDITFVCTSNVGKTTGSTIMVLTFKLPEILPYENGTEITDFPIKVVYGGILRADSTYTDCGFLYENKRYKILSIDGSVRIVDHLPGDVDDNDKVDLFDVLKLNKYLINQNQTIIDPKYGNVDCSSDGVQINDSYKLLRSLVGYESLLSTDYDVLLNTNGDVNEDCPDKIYVSLYENGSLDVNGKYSGLPELTRNGYVFSGWYTQIEGGTEVTNGSYIKYNDDQKVQTLYAHWVINSLSIFSEDSIQIGDTKYYNCNNYEIDILDETKASKDIKGNNGDWAGYNLKLWREFDYYSIGEFNGERYSGSTFDLSENGGSNKLYAHYKYYITNGSVKISLDDIEPKQKGYKFIEIQNSLNERIEDDDLKSMFNTNNKNITFNAVYQIINFKVSFAANGGNLNMKELIGITEEDLEKEIYNCEKPFFFDIDINETYNNYIGKKGYEFKEFAVNVVVNQKDGCLEERLENGDQNFKEGYFSNSEDLADTKTRFYLGYIDGIQEDYYITIMAIWTPKSYDLNLQLNSDSISKDWKNSSYNNESKISGIGCDYDSKKYILDFEEPTLNGCNFLGWSTSPNGNIKYRSGDIIYQNVINDLLLVDGYSEKALYAVWDIDPYTIGKYVNNNTTITNSYGNISYKVYNSEFPRFLYESSYIPHIIDLSNMQKSKLTSYEGELINICSDLHGETYIIGNEDYTYEGNFLCFKDIQDGDIKTLHLMNFNFKSTSEFGAICNYGNENFAGCEGGKVFIDIHGNCSLSTTNPSALETISLKNQEIEFTGDGTLRIEGYAELNSIKLISANSLSDIDDRLTLVGKVWTYSSGNSNSLFCGWYVNNSLISSAIEYEFENPQYFRVEFTPTIRTSSTVIFSSSDDGRKVITDSDDVYEVVYPNLSSSILQQYGYTKFKVSITFKIKEINDGYQDLWIFSNTNQELKSFRFEHGSGKVDKSWGTYYTGDFYIDLDDTDDDGSFKLRWGAYGNGDDDWYLGYTNIVIEAVK